MPRQGRIQKQAPEEDKKGRQEEQFAPDQRSFGMPNSLMRGGMMTPPPGMPNSVMREIYPEDSGGLFGSRGSAPTVGAHEISHTVRPAPVTRSVPSGTIQRDPTNPGSHEGAAAAAEPEEEEESVETQLSATLHSAPMLMQVFRNDPRIGVRIRQLREQIAHEPDPDIAGEIRDFVDRLENAAPNIAAIIQRLKAARASLHKNKDDDAAKRTVIEETRRYREYVGLHRRYMALQNEPDMAADLHETKDMMEGFEEVKDEFSDESIDFGFSRMGDDDDDDDAPPPYTAPVVYSVPPAAAAAPPSYGTPGGYDEPPAAAAADTSHETPGSYDEPPAPDEEDKSAKPSRKGGFFGWFKKK